MDYGMVRGPPVDSFLKQLREQTVQANKDAKNVKRAAPLNSSFTQQPKRTAFNNINNIAVDVNTRLVKDTEKLSLKSDKIETKACKVVLNRLTQNAENKGIPKPVVQAARVKSREGKNEAKKESKVDAVADSSISKIPRPVSKTVKPELPSFSSCVIPSGVENIDENDQSNCFLTADYVNEIYDYLRYLEAKYKIKPDHLSKQKEFTPKMRSVLIDWLVSVHYRFVMTPETLYMAVALFDRFSQLESLAKQKIQLVGITALFIAAKYEEVFPPIMNDFVKICDKIYTNRDIIRMEMSILKRLNFELGRPLPIHFLRRFSKAAHADSVIHNIAKYLMELSLLEYQCASWEPSLIAATALYVSLKSVDSSQKWTKTLAHYTQFTEEQLKPYVTILCNIIIQAPASKLQNCRKKYASAKFNRISKRDELESTIVEDMANGRFSTKQKTSSSRTASCLSSSPSSNKQ